jgi:drug/metabolite transporter (DMT)-like permease
MGAASAVGYALGAVLRGASVRQWNEPVAGALIGAVAGLALHLVIGSGHRSMLREIRAGDPIGVRLYALGGVLTITAQMCTIAAMRHIPVAIATVITLCTPLVVLPASYFLLRNRERIGLAMLAGAVLTMAGMAVIVLA